MKFFAKVEDLAEIKALPEEDRTAVLYEYTQGWHFLLFMSKLFSALLYALLLGLITYYLADLNGWLRGGITLVICLPIFYCLNRFYINVIVRRALKDLIKDQYAIKSKE
jgi:hypothetical protein